MVILSGQLKGGTQLPSTRELAADLSLLRNTVMNAFELLLAEGYINGVLGSGTFVEVGVSRPWMSHAAASRLNDKQATRALSQEVRRTRRLTHLQASLPAIPFRTGLPALDKFPLETRSKVVARVSRRMLRNKLNYSGSARQCDTASYDASAARGGVWWYK